MNIHSNEELLAVIGEAFLWDIVGAYVENDLQHIKEALIDGCGWIALETIERITALEVHQSDEFIVTGFRAENGVLTVSYEMPAIIMAWNRESKEALLRITTFCTGTVEIPDADAYDWNALDFENMRKQELLSHSNLVKNINVTYEDTEADDLTALGW